jgi:hypothetical protein
MAATYTPERSLYSYSNVILEDATHETLARKAVRRTFQYRKDTGAPIHANCATVGVRYKDTNSLKEDEEFFSDKSYGTHPDGHGERRAWNSYLGFLKEKGNGIEIVKVVVHTERSPCFSYHEDSKVKVCKDFFNELKEQGKIERLIFSVKFTAGEHGPLSNDIMEVNRRLDEIQREQMQKNILNLNMRGRYKPTVEQSDEQRRDSRTSSSGDTESKHEREKDRHRRDRNDTSTSSNEQSDRRRRDSRTSSSGDTESKHEREKDRHRRDRNDTSTSSNEQSDRRRRGSRTSSSGDTKSKHEREKNRHRRDRDYRSPSPNKHSGNMNTSQTPRSREKDKERSRDRDDREDQAMAKHRRERNERREDNGGRASLDPSNSAGPNNTLLFSAPTAARASSSTSSSSSRPVSPRKR